MQLPARSTLVAFWVASLSYVGVLACSADLEDQEAAPEPVPSEQVPSDPASPESWVLVRGGDFTMGIEASDIEGLKERYGIGFPQAFQTETPARRITVGDFRLDRVEVTNERFAAFVTASPGWSRERLSPQLHNGDYLLDWDGVAYPQGKGDHPVVYVTWHAAAAFCAWAGGRLPTEAEWEYAARCGDDREFPWGDELPSPERANYHASGHGTTVAAGSYPPNDCGLQDLVGSVWEFLYDRWEPTHDAKAAIDPCVGCPVASDEILEVEGRRAVRGGSFDGSVVNLRTRWRDSHV